MEYGKALTSLLLGLFFITVIYILGALIAKKIKFKHSELINFSAAVYFTTAFYAAKNYPFFIVIAINLIIAIYESTLANKLAIIINSDPRFTGSSVIRTYSVKSIIASVIISLIASVIGILASKI